MMVTIKSEDDLIIVVQNALNLAHELGFSKTKQYMIATSVSELARNILVHVGEGVVYISNVKNNNKRGIEVIAQDNGEGISDISKVLEDNYSTVNSLGIGLPGTKRLMDDFIIKSELGKGSEIIIRKWL